MPVLSLTRVCGWGGGARASSSTRRRPFIDFSIFVCRLVVVVDKESEFFLSTVDKIFRGGVLSPSGCGDPSTAAAPPPPLPPRPPSLPPAAARRRRPIHENIYGTGTNGRKRRTHARTHAYSTRTRCVNKQTYGRR